MGSDFYRMRRHIGCIGNTENDMRINCKSITNILKVLVCRTHLICLVLSWAFPASKALGQSNSTLAIAPVFLKHEPIKPIPLDLKQDAKKVALGRDLFNDKNLSADNTVSCASCHSLSKGGTDGRPHSFGIKDTEGLINSPTVFNSGFNFKQFWDGRADTLEDQIDGPIQAPGEMGSAWPDVLRKIKSVPAYVSAFNKIYPDGVQQKNIKNAIAEFERSLYTPNSRFDQYLRGNVAALTAEEKEGYHKFKALGCASCHQGVNVGGNMFERLGAMEDYFTHRGTTNKADLGRFNITGKEEDKYVFKVPSLRNVAVTGPYFHDGSAKTLPEALEVMARYQLGRSLSAEENRNIVSFLNSLTGEYQGKPL